jgi:hypothetical protein
VPQIVTKPANKNVLIRNFLVAIGLPLSIVSVNSSWLFNPYGWVDHWAYFGQANFLLNLRQAFPSDPSGDLLPVIWPQYLLSHFLPNLLAESLLGIFMVLFTTLLLILIVSKNFGETVSYFIACMWVGSQYALTSLGASYPAGFVIFYLLLTIYFLQRKQKFYRGINLNLLLASMTFTLSFYSAVLSIIYLPSLFIFYFLYHSILQEHRWNSKEIRSPVIQFSIVFVFTTIILQVIYNTYGHGFFFSNSINKLLGFTIGNNYRAPGFSTWLPGASWLLLPLIICFIQIYLYTWVKWHKSKITISTPFFALSVSVMLAQLFVNIFLHQWSLQFMYFNQTIGVYFLALASIVSIPIMLWSKGKQCVLLASTFLISIFSLFVANTKHYTSQTFIDNFPFAPFFLVDPLQGGTGPDPLRLGISLVVIIPIVIFISIIKKKFSAIALSILIFINIFSFSPSFGCFACFDAVSRQGIFPGVESMSQNQSATLVVAKFIDRIDRNRTAKIWFNEMEPLGPVFRQINSVSYLNNESNRVSKSFPNISEGEQPLGSGSSSLKSGDQVLVLSSNMKDEEALFGTLKILNLESKLISKQVINFSSTHDIYIWIVSVS